MPAMGTDSGDSVVIVFPFVDGLFRLHFYLLHVCRTNVKKQKPLTLHTCKVRGDYLSGPYWDRTSDPHNVNVVLYR